MTDRESREGASARECAELWVRDMRDAHLRVLEVMPGNPYHEARVALLNRVLEPASPPSPAAAPELRPSVVHRDGPYTPADYDEAIEALLQARAHTMDWALGNGQDGCRVCWDNGHTAEQCHHNPLVMAREATRRRTEYRCYHCGFLATTDEDAREHFGPNEHADASCLTSQVRTLQEELRTARGEFAAYMSGVADEVCRLEDSRRTLQEENEAMRERLERSMADRDDAVGLIGVMRDEMVIAGMPGGDRSVLLANFRELLKCRAALSSKTETAE